MDSVTYSSRPDAGTRIRMTKLDREAVQIPVNSQPDLRLT